MSTNQRIMTIAAIITVAITGYLTGAYVGRSDVDSHRVGAADPASAEPDQKREILYWRAPMDATEIYDQPGVSAMGMELLPVYADELTDSAEGLVSIHPTTSQNMGVRSEMARVMDFSRVIRTVGEVTYDEEHLYEVNSRVSGWIERLYVNYVGAPVSEGDPLLEIYSPELVTTQEEFLLAQRTLETARASGQVSAVNDATKLVASAQKRLQNWEIPEEVITRLRETGEVSRTVLLRAPATGIVNQKLAVDGAHVMSGMKLFQIADLRTVWVHASFYEDEAPWITTGQNVEMELSYLPGKQYEGTVSYVYPYLREKARDVHVRLVFSNPSLDLKPGMYVNVELQGRVIPDAIVVPVESVLRSGERTVVFVVRDEGRFEPREISIAEEGGPGNAFVRVLGGLDEHERVVVSAQFLLDSESRLQEAIRKMIDVPDQSGSMRNEMPATMDHMSAMPDSTRAE